MADDTNEDSWLYGTSNPDSTTNDEEKKNESETQEDEKIEADQSDIPTEKEQPQQSPDSNQIENKDEENPADEMEEQETENEDKEKEHLDSDLDDSDDDINVVIGDIKSTPTYNIKQRSNILPQSSVITQEKPKQTVGKFSIDEFESVGTINGIPAQDFSIDLLDDKPWRKPGADITDYFNYGFNEDTWRAYCERQKRLRINESGVGLQGLSTGQNMMSQPIPTTNRTLTPLTNSDSNKYTGNIGVVRKIGPPVVRKISGNDSGENVIQVMTAERREYSRPGNMAPLPFNGNDQYFEQDMYSYGYEPTQDLQWMNDNSSWTPSGIKELTPGPQMVPPPMAMHQQMPMRPPMCPPPMAMQSPHMGAMQMQVPSRMMPPHIDREKDCERERSERERDRRDREKEKDYERARERDYERNRDRGKSEDLDRQADSPARDRERRKTDRHRDRDRERSIRRERSRSRERSRRRSRSRDRDRKTREKKKSHRKEKDDSE